MKKSLLGLLAVAFVVFVTSCGKVPQAEIDAVNKLIDSSKVVGADVYLPDQFAAVQDTMKAVTEKVEAQKSKLFKKYTDVSALLTVASKMSNDLIANTAVKKEEVKQQGATMLEELKTLTADNKKLILKAPKGKEGAAALQAINADLTVIDGAITEATSLWEGGNYMAALDKIKAAKEKAASINDELKAAIKKVRR
jgi:hypothetical protein